MSLSILDLLRADGSIVVNKKLAHQIGLDSAVVYSELVSLFIYWRDRGELVNDSLEKNKPDSKWFFCTMDTLEKNTTLKRTPQDKAIKNLERLGLIETKKMGLPRKRYFTITSGIYKFFADLSVENQQTDNDKGFKEKNKENLRSYQSVENQQTVLLKTDTLDGLKSTTNNTKNNTELINDDDDINNKQDHERNIGNDFYEKDKVRDIQKDVVEVTMQVNGVPEELIDLVLEEMTPDDVFSSDVVKVAVQSYRQKLQRGESVSSFGKWFIKTLRTAQKEKIGQATMQQAFNQRFNIPDENAATVDGFPFYNWLEEE